MSPLGNITPIELVERANRSTAVSRKARVAAHKELVDKQLAIAAEQSVTHDTAFLVGARPRVFIPGSYNQAMKCTDAACWRQGCDKEMCGQVENGTWTFVEASSVPPGTKCLPMVWTFRYKMPTPQNPDGVFKCRVCPNGSTMVAGEDYDEHKRSSPVAERSSFRIICCLTAMRCLVLEAVDLSQAYLQQKLPMRKPIYAYCPQGYNRTGKDGRPMRMLAHAPCYGLPFSGFCLYESLSDWLRRIGLKQCIADPCVWTWKRGRDELLCCITVDDLVFAGSSKGFNDEFVSRLREQFTLTRTENVTHVLGLDLSDTADNDRRSIGIDASQLIDDVADDHDLQRAATVDNPIASSPQYDEWTSTDQSTIDHLLTDKRLRSLCGSANYISAVCRPDIALAASMVSRAVGKPSTKCYMAAKRIICYLRGSRDRKLTWHGHTSKPVPWDQISLITFVDADHMSSGERSQTGFCLFLSANRGPHDLTSGGAIDWASRKQGCTALYAEPTDQMFAEDDSYSVAAHSSDAELIAISDVIPRVRHLRLLLKELGATQQEASPVFNDSEAVIKYIHADTSPALKHLNARARLVREARRVAMASFLHVNGATNPSDQQTKRLVTRVHCVHTNTLLGTPPPREE